MVVRATAIPLACFPFSNSSRVVHWLTRHHGKISTLLKGAMRSKSPFLGEYDLFCTSELLYFEKRINTLHTGKECAMLHRRDAFRSDWRAMQTASYLTALFDRTTPEETPQPGLFALYEELLDHAEVHGHHPEYLVWAELRFCAFHGHAPTLDACVHCSATKALRFCASQGGVVCTECSRARKHPILECPSALLAGLQAWQKADHPEDALRVTVDRGHAEALHAIMSAFMMYQFGVPVELRDAAVAWL